MSLASLLARWRADPAVYENVVEWRVLPARPARYAPFPEDMPPALASALREHGVASLYLHQAQALQHARRGAHLVVVTGTASGKTLSYNLPILDRLLRDPQARTLYLFPTKALAQDQHANLDDLCLEMSGQGYGATPASGPSSYLSTPISPAVYDGDTPTHNRPSIRKKARLVISNPDMLHAGILPHHTAWAEFFQDLQFVVIDEMHAYRGVFGSHVANVLRRLKRVARFYGAAPQFILTSATIANPLQLAEWLVEEPVALVDEDGSARGPKHFLLYNPPIVDRELGLRRSLLQESLRLAGDLLDHGVQTILFGRARRTVELLLTYLRQSSLEHEREAIRGYRSGYLPRQRRAIERGLRQGSVRAVVATNALELGIDIGGMGASLLAGYPGTIAGTWQQAGRAGRGNDPSLSILVASAGPLDQFLVAHPDYFFGRSPEQALINPNNLLILLGHLRCAAFELPFQEGEAFGGLPAERVSEFLDFLQESGSLHHSGGKYFWMADQYPAERVSLRSASPDTVVLQRQDGETFTAIGEVDRPSATWMVHPDAIYLHEGQSYQVKELDLEGKTARLEAAEVDYYTEPLSETTVELVETQASEEAQGGSKSHGEITVTTQVTGFRKIRWHTMEQLGTGELALPPSQLQTTGYWLALAEETVKQLVERGLWTNSPNNYGPNWAIQRDRARQRDGYLCQVCALPEGGRSHDVHHKVPFRTFSGHEQANQLHNLVTLCPACHQRAETAVRMRSGLSGLAFALANLAPLFLMCDARDLGVHSDPQSPLAEGKPAVVIYDQVPAGIGFSQQLFERHAEILDQARELVAGCECAEGCPSCVGPSGEAGVGGKRETMAILDLIA